MNTDFRIKVEMFHHPKLTMLKSQLGFHAAYSLFALLGHVAIYHSETGSLEGMSNAAIGMVAEYPDGDEFVSALVRCGFLDGEPGDYRIHDWAENNPYAANAKERSRIASENAKCRKRDNEPDSGLQANGKQTASKRQANGSVDSNRMAEGLLKESERNVSGIDAPSPVPVPTPSVRTKALCGTNTCTSTQVRPKPTFDQPAAGLRYEEAFEQFWVAYPRHEKRQAALSAWKKLNPDAGLVSTILERVRVMAASPEWTTLRRSRDNRDTIPHPASWLNGRRWEDDLPLGVKPAPPPAAAADPARDAMTIEERSLLGLPENVREMTIILRQREREQLAAARAAQMAARHLS